MKTIDLTPTWEQWLNMAFMIINNAKQDKRQEAIETLMPDFKKMAKLATTKTAELQKREADKIGDPSMDKSIDWIREASSESLKRLCEAIDWQLAPYIDEYSEETLKSEYLHIHELAIAYSNITGFNNMQSKEDLSQ